MRQAWLAVMIAAVWICRPAPAGAQDCLRECAGELACESQVYECLIANGQTRDAIKRLKTMVRRHPEQGGFARLLARAYMADNNPFWAQRTLQAAIAGNAADCESLAWLAWLHVGQGDLDLARQLIHQPGCKERSADRSRWLLLEAFMEHAEHKPGAADLVLRVSDEETFYPEDRQMWLFLRQAEDPGWIEPVSLRLETSFGVTSNSKAGSPTDPGTEGSYSALGRLDLFGRFVWPASRGFRPSLEAGLKGHGLVAEEARSLSYLEMSARPGVILGAGFPRVLVGYKLEYLVLNQDLEIQRRFYEGHRGEMEVEFGALTAFAGAGRRFFHENGRTRWELDGGLGGSFSFLRRVHLLAALSLRYYEAIGDPYDLVGTTAVAVGRVNLGAGFYARLGATVGLDYYLHSGGERGKVAYGSDRERFDVLTKLSAGAWSPPWQGLRFGLFYEFSWRESSVDSDNSTDDYDYKEHRLLAKVRFTFDLNPWAPDTVEPEGHLALDWGIGGRAGTGMDEERIQDLLRQDEAARRGSSCVD